MKQLIHYNGVTRLLGTHEQPDHWGMLCDADTLPLGTVIENVGMGQSTVCASMDFETYSEAGYVYKNGKVKGIGSGNKGGLGVVGTPVYAEHPSADILCLFYDLKDGKGRRGWIPNLSPRPLDLMNYIANGGMVEAWNITFEFWIWNLVAVRKYGFPPLQLEQCVCVMARSRRHSLPGSLGKAAIVLGTANKDDAGVALIRKLTRPHTPTKKRPGLRWTPGTAWDDFQALYKYCDQDVKTEDEAAARIPDLTPYERETWLTDQRINARGVQVDVEALDACLDIQEQAEKLFTVELVQLTQGAVSSVGEVAKIIDFLASGGVCMDDLGADAVKEKLAEQDLHPVARRVLEIRQALASANVKKLRAIKLQLNSDGRLRDQYIYCGADQTGRWSAGGVQLQNLTSKGPKSKKCDCCGRIVGKVAEECPECMDINFTDCPDWTVEAVEFALQDIQRRDINQLMKVWGDPITVLCGCLRGLFIAKQDHILTCCDFSAIEAVAAACLSRCQWRIDVFNTHGKIYEMSASKISGVPFEEILQYKKDHGRDHPLRKGLGKVAELACFTRNTQVLTRRGYVRMVEVKPTDELWDGVEWVTSDGVIPKGKRKVIKLDGVGVTPDHPVSLNGSWKPASLLASSKNTLALALATGSANLPSLVTKLKASEGSRTVFAHAVRKASTIYATCTPVSLRAAVHAGVKKAVTLISNVTTSMLKLCQTRNTDAVCAIGSAQQSAAAITPKLKATLTTAAAGSQCVTSGGKTKSLFYSMCRRSKVGMTRVSKWTGSKPTGTMSRIISGLLQKLRTAKISDLLLRCKNGSMSSKSVYDIVNAGPRHRFTIKTDSGHLIVHNSGYGGWIGAWKAFGAEDHFDNEQEMKDAIVAWRAANPEIVEMWGGQHRQVGAKPWDSVPELYGLEGAAVAAIMNPNQTYQVNDITFGMKDDILLCRLPSGRFLHYHRPKLVPCLDHFKRESYKITFEGWNSNPQKGKVGWIVKDTYGGRLFENVVQAVSADIQAEALVRLEQRGYPVVMHTHDEGTAETPINFGSVEEMEAIMAERPQWASWWPLRSAGWRHKRYQKD